MVGTNQKSFNVEIIPSSKQTNSYDCGVYAVANATAITCGLDPSKIEFTPNLLRPHFINCLIAQKLTLFPYTEIVHQKDPLVFNVQVDCICRRPLRFKLCNNINAGERAIECMLCKEKYHRACIPKNDFNNYLESNGHWTCKLCKQCNSVC